MLRYIKYLIIQSGQITSTKNQKQKNEDKVILSKSVSVYIIKVIFSALTFLSSLIFTKFTGAHGYGVYAYVISLITVVSIPATLGLDRLLIREISIYNSRKSWEHLRGILLWSNRLILWLSLTISIIATLILIPIKSSISSELLNGLQIGFISLPFLVLRNLRVAVMKGLGKTVAGILPEQLISPLLLILISTSIYLIKKENISSTWLLTTYAIAAMMSFLIGSLLVRCSIPQEAKTANFSFERSKWIKSAFPMILIGSFAIINSKTDILMIGTLVGSNETGIYAVVSRISDIVRLALISVGGVFAAKIAELYALGNHEKLQALITKSSYGISFTAVLSFALLLLLGQSILSLFGPEFRMGYPVLIILSFGQLVNACTGSAGFLLIMTGHEAYMSKIMIGSGFVNILLNLLLIPNMGMIGASIATLISTTLWNLLLGFFVWNNLNINPTAFRKI